MTEEITRAEFFDNDPRAHEIGEDDKINDWLEGSVQPVFPTRIGKFHVSEEKYSSIHNDIKPKIYSHLEYLKKKGLIQDKESYNLFDAKKDGWTSFYGRSLLEMPEFYPIINLIHETIYRSMNHAHGSNDYLIEMNSCWFTVYEQNQCVPFHTHPGSYLSGVYYFQAEGDCGDIVFKDPIGCMKDMVMNSSPMKVMDSYGVLAIRPRTGTLLLFPSWLPHETRPNPHDDKDRIIFSFNLHLGTKTKPKFKY